MSLQFNAGGARGGCCLADGGDTGLAVSGAAKARDHMAKSMALAERASRGRIPTAKPSLFSLYRFTLTYARFPLPLALTPTSMGVRRPCFVLGSFPLCLRS